MSFTVGTDDLRIAAHGVAGLLADIEGVAGQVRSADSGAAGHPSLGGAIDSFKSVWSPGLAQLHEAVSALSQNLGSTASAYDTADHGISAAFRQ